MLPPGHKQNELSIIQNIIDEEVFLKLSVVDFHTDDDTLVVMTDHQVPCAFVKMILQKVWNGPVEVFCASAIMAGSAMSFR